MLNSLADADKLHSYDINLELLQRDFSALHVKAKSEHADIFRKNPSPLAALGFIDLTLCYNESQHSAYKKNYFSDRANFIFITPIPIIEEQPAVLNIDQQNNLKPPELLRVSEDQNSSTCKNFLNTMLSCANFISTSFRKPPTRVAPEPDHNFGFDKKKKKKKKKKQTRTVIDNY